MPLPPLEGCLTQPNRAQQGRVGREPPVQLVELSWSAATSHDQRRTTRVLGPSATPSAMSSRQADELAGLLAMREASAPLVASREPRLNAE